MGEAGLFLPEERTELIDGTLMLLLPIGPNHAGHLKRLVRLFSRLLIEQRLDHVMISTQDPVRLNEHSEPVPDLCLLRARADDYTHSHPTPDDLLLVIEVSDATLDYDRRVKRPLYAQAGVQECWIVAVAEGYVEVCRRPECDDYAFVERLRPDQAVAPQALPTLRLNLADVLR